MKPWGWVVSAIVLYLGAVLDQAITAAQMGSGPPPLFLPAMCLVIALFSRPLWGAILGFLGGWLWGAVLGTNIAQLAIPLLVMGFAVSTARKLQLELNVWVAGIWVFVGVLVCRVAYLILTSATDLGPSLLMAVVSSLLAALVSLPVYALLSRSAAAEGS